MSDDSKAHLLAQLSRILRDYADDRVAGGLRVVEAMLASGLHWPDLLPPKRYGFRFFDLPMLDLIGIAVECSRNLTPFDLAILAVIAAKPLSMKCTGTSQRSAEPENKDRETVFEIISRGSSLDACDGLPVRRFGVA